MVLLPEKMQLIVIRSSWSTIQNLQAQNLIFLALVTLSFITIDRDREE